MYFTVSYRPGPRKCLTHAVTANNLSFGRLDKSNDDAQINHFCLRSRIRSFISNLSLPELSDVPSIWLLIFPLHTPQNAVLPQFHYSILSWHSLGLPDFPLLSCGFLSLPSPLYLDDLHIITPSVFPPPTCRSTSPFLSQTL